MHILTIRTVEELSKDMQLEIHYAFGMEHHSDYIFQDKKSSIYSATINLQSTSQVIAEIIRNSVKFPGITFMVDDLNIDSNKIIKYKICKGESEKF